ncbi:glycine betaine ABC transporter substrate-binding protein [Georgenia sp. Z1344]|uniref:glycine betaine ABC transporter substrate-binding protein n=1 Tax=Georgenia sp. Z1344 TaxID=3416706 RepID=UPI003CEE3EAC
MRTKRLITTAATVSALALTLAACGGGEDESEDTGGDTSGDSGEGGGDSGEGGGEGGEITIGVHSGWEEGIAVSHLWQAILEEQGYDVTLETAEAGVVFTGLAEGDFDLNFDTWLPNTHSDYIEQYGDDLEELGMWYENAPLTMAVNEDAPIQSLDELADNADEFGNRIVGIEPGAGLTRITTDEVIPTYGLEDMEYVISSTTAMLSELSAAIDAGDNVVVTLWRPHWAYDAFPIRDLEDPEGAFGEPDNIYTYGNAEFSSEFPEVAEWISGFTFEDAQLAELENIMFNEMGGNSNDEAVDQWLEDNPDFIDSVVGGGSGSESGSESSSEDGAETES